MSSERDSAVAKGVVHGHIHNFNNLTYIHGHVHRRSSMVDNEAGSAAAPPLSEFHDSSVAPMPASSNEVDTETDDQGICSQFQDCQHFEFMNYHNLNVFNENQQASARSDDLLVLPEKRRRLTDCSCQPRVVKICCDVDHEYDGKNHAPTLNDDIVLFTNEAKPAQLPTNAALPEFINCDLTCAPQEMSDDRMFEELCEQCMNLDDQEDTCMHTHDHAHTHSHNEDELLSHDTSFHDHIINTTTDLKILEDLTSISSMYDFPFGKHIHSEMPGGKSNELNLLQTTVSAVKTEDDDMQLNKTHHHHRVEVHPHSAPPANVPAGYSNERDTQASQNSSMEFSKLHHHLPPIPQPTDMTRTNTINFKWAFKDDLSKVNCQWDHCPETCDNLIDLQKHILKDHVLDTPLPIMLPTPQGQFDCSWGECEYSGEDICSLVNHINGQHGIAFDMKFVDQHKIEEQSEQHHQLHKGDQQPEKKSHICKWENCNQEFLNEQELNNHIEECHISRGKSSYKCNWDSCGKVFTQRQKILRHLKVHTKYKPFECPYCSKTFSTEDILQQHIRTHSGEKPFKCTFCTKSFATSSSLRIHVRTHTGEKPLQCKVCGKRFNESSNLSKHMKTHERQYKCKSCKRSFHKLEQYQLHQNRCPCCARRDSNHLNEKH